MFRISNNISFIISCFCVVVIAFYPIIISILFVPTNKMIIDSPSIQLGTITTQSGNIVTVNIMLGNVFNPQENSKDIGFDLVGVSCYFDPIKFENHLLLPSNPLLNSALRASAGSKEELSYFIKNLFQALESSRDVVTCFMTNDKISSPCKGDKLEPYVWAVYNDSPIFKDNGVKYIAALPLFNPNILLDKIPVDQTRERLSENVESAVSRILGYSLEELKPTVRSVAFAALGSTSHSSDSRYFLDFETGFLSILKGIQQSHSHSTLKRIYLVGYNKHKGIFLQETINGLKSVAQYLLLFNIFSKIGTLTVSIYTILWIVSAIFSYQKLKDIWKKRSRWPFFATIVTSTTVFILTTYGVTSSIIMQLHPKYFKFAIFGNLLITIICYIILLIFSKRILINNYLKKRQISFKGK